MSGLGVKPAGKTVGKTITKTDLCFFKELTSWPNNLLKKDNIVPELLLTMVAIGLMNREGFLEKNLIAVLENRWEYCTNTYVQDTIWLNYEIVETSENSKGDKSTLILCLKVNNQKNEIVSRGYWKLLLKSGKV